MIVQLALAAALWQAHSADQVLDNVREAVGYSKVVGGRGVEISGSTNYLGIETTFSFLFDPKGQYRFTVEGRVGLEYGWDGSKGWETDYSGATGRTYMEALDLQHGFARIVTHRWLDPEGPYHVSMAETEPGGDSYTLNLKLKDGQLEQTVVVDDETWLPEVTRYNSTAGEYAVFFKEWKNTGQGVFPHFIETEEGGLKGSFTVKSVGEMPVFIQSPFTMPKWSVDEDTRFDSTKEGKVEAKRTFSGHILVKPTIGGKDVGWFILDSGAGGMVIDTAVAKRLGGERFAKMLVIGVGGASTSGYFEFDGFSLGPATVDGLLFVDYDLQPFSNLFGSAIGGIVGYDFFRRATVDIDLSSADVLVSDPQTDPNPTISWMELVLDNRHPTIEAEFEGGITGRFRIDTGANGSVSFNRPTVVKHDLLSGRETRNARQRGVNGFVESERGRLEYFTMSGRRWENVQATFSTSDEGIHGGSYLSGNLGQDLLRAFRLVLDYPNNRIALIEKK